MCRSAVCVEQSRTENRVYVYDSQRATDEATMARRAAVVDTIRKWHQGVDGEEMQVRWEQVPQQENDEDCGVAMVMTMRRRMLIRRKPRGGQGWEYTAQDFEGMRWKMAAEMCEDRVWLMGDDRATKTQRIMQVDGRYRGAREN